MTWNAAVICKAVSHEQGHDRSSICSCFFFLCCTFLQCNSQGQEVPVNPVHSEASLQGRTTVYGCNGQRSLWRDFEVAATAVTSLLQNDSRPHEERSICRVNVKLLCRAETFWFEPGMLFFYQIKSINKQQIVLKLVLIDKVTVHVRDSSKRHIYWANIRIWRWPSMAANSTACTADGFLNSSRKSCRTISGGTQLPYGTFDLWPVQTNTQYLAAGKLFTQRVVCNSINELVRIFRDDFQTL